MYKENELPIIWLEVDMDDMEEGMSAISFVTSPATEITWNRFNENKNFKFEKNEMERIVTGPIMLANTPIYRYSDLIGPYFCKFSEKTIKTMRNKYFKENKIHTINEQHNSKRRVGGVYMVESFVVGDKVESKLYPDLPAGTWMGSFYVEDKDYWDNVIMSDIFTGFSLEGAFDQRFEDDIIEEKYSEIVRIVSSDKSDKDKEIELRKLLRVK